MTKPRKNFACIIWGGYAWGNTGDEICLAAALERAQQEFGDSVAILSYWPERTARLFPKANVIPFFWRDHPARGFWAGDFRDWLSLLTSVGRKYRRAFGQFLPDSDWVHGIVHARRLYLAGGGYLTNLFDLGSFLHPVELAIKMRLSVVTAPVGLGPFAPGNWTERVVHVLRHMDLTVRDKVSLDFCRAHGVAAKLEPDDGFAWVKQLPPAARDEKAARPRKIGVCIFSQYGREKNHDDSAWGVECLRGLVARFPGHEIEGFCFHSSPEADWREMTKLFPIAGLSVNRVLALTEDFRHATENIRDYDLVISTRFHAVVAANVFQVPNIAIAAGGYYQAKMQAAATGYEAFSDVIDPGETSPEALLALCEKKLAGRVTSSER